MKPKLDIGLFVDLAEFPCFYQFLHEVAHKIVQQIKTKQFYEQLHARTGKNREIQLNQQTIWCQVLDWLNKLWSCLIFIKLYYLVFLFFFDLGKKSWYISGMYAGFIGIWIGEVQIYLSKLICFLSIYISCKKMIAISS